VKSLFEEIFETIRQKLDADDEVRESSLKASRKSVRLSQEAVSAIQRGDFESARASLDECAKLILELNINLKNNSPEIYYKGNVMTMHQEYVEAALLFALIEGTTEIQGPEALNVSSYAYIGGLGDLIGELRRYSLNAIKEEKFQESERGLRIMEEIYQLLRTLDYPEGMLPGVRRKVDIARSLIERTRSDLTYFKHGNDLVDKMDSLLDTLNKIDINKE
jgi:translin